MKIGITEQGDAALDLSWINKLNNVDGAIIISKGFNGEFKKELIENQSKIIYHATITCLGKSIIEPNVDNFLVRLNDIKKLIYDGFNTNHIVIRIDPIIGNYLYNQIKDGIIKSFNDYYCCIKYLISYCIGLGITRFRYSFLDLYNHVRERFESIGLEVPEYALSFDEYYEWANLFREFESEYSKVLFESCAEKFVPENHKIGCISKKDLSILGLDPDLLEGSSNQRKYCLCPSCKTELLNNRHRCEHKCIYCYWKD